jgi:hypothetical protein
MVLQLPLLDHQLLMAAAVADTLKLTLHQQHQAELAAAVQVVRVAALMVSQELLTQAVAVAVVHLTMQVVLAALVL